MRIQACQIPMHYLHHIAALLSSMGVDTHAWLAKNHLQTQQLQETTHSLSFTQFCQLVHDAIMLSGEPALGLLLGKRLSLNAHGLLGYAAMSSGTLCEALQVFERYGRLRTPLLKIQQQNTLIVVQERYPLPDDLRRSVSEAVVLTLKNMLDSLSGIMHPVRSVQFAFPAPSYAARVVQLFQWALFGRMPSNAIGMMRERYFLKAPDVRPEENAPILPMQSTQYAVQRAPEVRRAQQAGQADLPSHQLDRVQPEPEEARHDLAVLPERRREIPVL